MALDDIVLTNCRIIDKEKDFYGSLGISGGRIQWFSSDRYAGSHSIDLRGWAVMPGFIDLHTHLRTPGQTDKEDFEHGLSAALKSGFTSVCGMPNTNPPVDSISVAEKNILNARSLSLARYFQIGAVGKNLNDSELSSIIQCNSDIRLFSNDGMNISDMAFLESALKLSKEKGFWVLAHCEPETEMVEMHLAALEKVGGNLHFCHISTKSSVEAIRKAKKKGLRFTSEATPHHMFSHSLMYRVNPPFGSLEDRQALREAVKDGTIEILATDHAPHTVNDKLAGANGISNLDYAFSMLWAVFSECGIPITRLSQMMSFEPAQKLGLDCGTISEGSISDLAVIDLEQEYMLSLSNFMSKSSNTPFEGSKLLGSVKLAIVGGKIVYDNR